MSYYRIKSLVVFSMAAILLMSTMGYSAELEEITVTAQKRTQNLQDVPIAITAFSLEELETFRIEGPEDLGKVTPGVYVTQNPADANGVRINIRGVGTLDPQVGVDARVGVYQDGVYLGKSQGLAFDLPDLARVEILKGPQGTLYGRNTVAGAVNLISAAPDPEKFSGNFKAEVGNFSHAKISGSANLPLSSNTAVRISGSYLERDGWVENSGPGVDFGGEEKTGFRVALGSQLTDTFRLDLAVDHSETDKEPLFYQSVGTTPAFLTPAITPFNNGRQENVETSFQNDVNNTESEGLTAIATWQIADNQELKVTAAYREIESTRFAALIPTTDPAILNAITGSFNPALAPLPFAFQTVGQSLRPDFASAFSGLEPERGLFLSDPGGIPTLEGHEQTSIDINYNADLGRLSFTGGLYYFDEETGNGDNSQAPTTNGNDYLFVLGQFTPAVTAPNIQNFIGTLDAAPDFPGVQNFPPLGPIPAAGVLLGQVAGGNLAAFPLLQQLVGDGSSCTSAPAPSNNFCIPTLSTALNSVRAGTNGDLRVDTEAFALYGQATYNITDNFRATVGLRYSDETKDGRGQPRVPFFNDTTTLTGQTILPNIGTWEDDSLDPSLTLEWDVNSDVLLYASYKESFRAGGFNATAVSLATGGETSGVDFIFDKEEISAFEVGMKGDFGDRIRVNAAAYYYDFTDKQTTVSTSPLIATERAIVNVDDEIYGLDIASSFVLTDAFLLNASLNYTDGDAGVPVNPVTGLTSDREDGLQGVPELSYTLSLDYNGTWREHDIFGNLTYSYSDEILSVPESFLSLPEIDLWSANIGVTVDLAGGNRATVSLWGQNLSDEEFLIDALPFDTFAFNVNVFSQPRSYGLSLALDF